MFTEQQSNLCVKPLSRCVALLTSDTLWGIIWYAWIAASISTLALSAAIALSSYQRKLPPTFKVTQSSVVSEAKVVASKCKTP